MEALIGDESSECEQELSINEDYAKKYTKWREKEELQKLKDRYGEDGLRDSSSESSSSEEEEEELNNAIEKDFLKAISLLKSKDPRIYDKNTYFFSDKEENDNKVKKKKKKEKPMYWKDQERQVLLEKDGVFSDDETEKLPAGYLLNSKQYKEERKQLKKSFEISSDSESDDEFLKEKKFLHNYWNNPDLNSDEVFLKDFLLNKKYMDKGDLKTSLIDDPNMEDEENLSEDEKILDQQETFEHKFNFRFEEPDPEFLKKKEELMRLKALKRKEIEEKLEKLKEITGNSKMAFEDLDFDSDFDPDKYDENMQKIFNDEYYKEEEEIQKPVFPSDEEIDAENWDNWTRENYENQDDAYYEPHCEDPDFIMDADYDPQKDFQRKLIESTKRRKGKRKSKFSEMISEKRPEFDPEIRNFENYLDEYYKLDYEDIIDDMPVRFSYRKVVPNDFGLTVDEILTADDKELNRWCSLKKTCQYRTKEEEIYDVKAFQKKSQNLNAKKKILLHSYQDKDDDQSSVIKNEKTQKIKSLDKNGEGTSNQQKVSVFIDNKTSSNNSYNNKKKWKKRNLIDNPPETKWNDTDSIHKNKKKRYKSKNSQVNNNCGFSDNRLKAYGINPKKYKNKFNRKKI
ncbi:protein KRI1 homolog [Centruroides sculpturatus]|uniref:protein KRI1 homolog n=1 Tax=Centruroides sculpturatus TaxID=218467 RepID=UPI000C6E3299|nr:protein KRI1 homolog [Centruroides sculpturatus]